MKVLLGVTGSVAAIYTPELVDDLRRAGHEVRVVVTKSAAYFFDPARIAGGVIRDEDEWPGDRYQRSDPVLHIELRRWADVLIVAPLDANTLAKFALGIVDNCLACVYRAWDRSRPIVLAPAMNTLMWEHPATARHLAQIQGDVGSKLAIVSPIEKLLACDDVGIGAMAGRSEIVSKIGEFSH
jgi:phosphopantothenoylcysteine decarboxylase